MAEVNKYPLDADEKGWFVRLGDITDLAIHRKAKEAYVQIIDGRPLSGEQRRMCYALINSVSEWSGQPAQQSRKFAFNDKTRTYVVPCNKKTSRKETIKKCSIK